LIVKSDNCPRPLSKWARRLAKHKALHNDRRAENQLINNAINKVRATATAMLDSGAMINLIQSSDGFELTGPSSKSVSTANGHIMKAMHTALLPLTQLNVGAREAIVIPEMSTQALMSIRQLADQGYTTVFHPYLQGATVHDNDSFKLVTNKSQLLQGWRDNGGLWTVPLAGEKALNVYELPSTKEVIRFEHATLGFPTKATLLKAIRNKNLVTFPGMSADNINKIFTESDSAGNWTPTKPSGR
jgi:hypothetical protein